MTKMLLDMPSPDAKDAALLASVIEPQSGEGSLPTGLKPVEAVLVLANTEKDLIRKQAIGQAENFEILGSKLVAQLSRVCRRTCRGATKLTYCRSYGRLTNAANTFAVLTSPFELDVRSFIRE